MIEAYEPYIEQLLRNEPWRAVGSADSPFCHGVLDWDGTPFWCCRACGRIGRANVTAHTAPVHPGGDARSFVRRFMRAIQKGASRPA